MATARGRGGTGRAVRDFSVQSPSVEPLAFVGVSGLSQAGAGEPVPGFRGHAPREYLYVLASPGAPRVELWVSDPGTISALVAAPADSGSLGAGADARA
eukprot:252746-Chlamydomonas_euryale.AAC.1